MTKLTLTIFNDANGYTLYNAISPGNKVIASSSNKKEILTIIDQVRNYSTTGCPSLSRFKKIMQK